MRIRPKPPPGPRILVVTAVDAELTAIRTTLGEFGSRITLQVGGVGMAAAATTTAAVLGTTERPYGLVVSAGIAGGFAGRAEVGATVIATRSIAADLGADAP